MNPIVAAAIIGGGVTLGAAGIKALANSGSASGGQEDLPPPPPEEDPLYGYDPTAPDQMKAIQQVYRDRAYKNMWAS